MVRKEVLVKRDYYFNLLDSNTISFRKGNGKNIALLGPRGCGKTTIVKEYIKNVKDIVPVYVDLARISLNPENFSIEFIGNVIFHFLKKPLEEYKKLLLLENILKIEEELKSKNAFSLIKTVENELLKIKPDQKLLVETAFKFSEALGKESNKKFLIALDNFENLLDLNNFSQIKDVLSIINFNAQNVIYLATSSAVKESLSLLKKFECYEIKGLEKNESIVLIESLIGKADKNIAGEIFDSSNGNPLVITIISKKYLETKNVREAFLIELLQKNNSLYNFCNDSLNYYYNRARGQTLLKTILKVVANEELRLSQIAKKLYRSAPVTKSILERLMFADIVYKKDNKFYFADNVLRLWFKLTSQGYDFDEIDEKILEKLMKEI